MDSKLDRDYFEEYLENFPLSPSLVLVRSDEAKNFPYEYIKEPVLDLACGDGFFGKIIGLDQFYSIGVDIDKKSLELAKSRNVYKDLFCDDAMSLSKLSSSFNTVIPNCAMEHITDVNQAIKKISKILNCGGHFIFSVPSEKLNTLFLFRDKLDEYNKRQRHFNIFYENIWIDILSQFSFSIQDKFYIFDDKQYRIAIFWMRYLKY